MPDPRVLQGSRADVVRGGARRPGDVRQVTMTVLDQVIHQQRDPVRVVDRQGRHSLDQPVQQHYRLHVRK
jgi:hypothetical protein